MDGFGVVSLVLSLAIQNKRQDNQNHKESACQRANPFQVPNDGSVIGVEIRGGGTAGD